MISRQLALQGRVTVPAVNITQDKEIPEALTQLKIHHPKSVIVLVNGGNISRTDVQYSLSANRTMFVMRGTGRMADKITISRKVSAVDISQKPEEILEFLKTGLV
jgi:hypothetical protein